MPTATSATPPAATSPLALDAVSVGRTASPRPPKSSPLELLLKYDKPVPRYTSYPTAAQFHSGVGPADLAAQLARPCEEPLSLYVHVPFCRHACWYCGCNRITTQLGSKVVAPYLQSLQLELELIAGLLPQRRRLAQVHWGGGTPNYLNAEEQSQLWNLVTRHFDLEPELEASIEVNPEFIDQGQALHLRALGFNRISFGIQDADPEVQRAVNRVVPVEQLRRVMGWLREARFESVNADLICGLPRQTPERFHTTLELVSDLRPERISLFSFAYLPEQLPLQRKIASGDLPSQRERLAMLDDASQLLGAAGYEAIGMDHYALAGDSLAIAAREGRLRRNFQGYTTGGNYDLLGVGPSAISQFPHLFSQNQRQLKGYNDALQARQLPVERGLAVLDAEVLERRALIREVMCHFRAELELARFAIEWEDLQGLAADGLVTLSQKGDLGLVEVTAEGRWLIRTIAAVFDPSQRERARGSLLI